MTCKGCLTFREKIRKWLGVDDLYLKLDKNIRIHIARKEQITQGILVGLVETVEAAVQKNTADLIALERKFVSVGGKLQEHTREFRLVRDAMRVDSDEVALLTDAVAKLEFPGYRQVRDISDEG